MAKRRSPNYPRLSFPETLEYAKKIYAEAQRHTTDRSNMAKILGYKGISGRSLGVIGALKAYGLLEGGANNIGISKDAESIIVDPVGSLERNDAILRCAFAPQVFQTVQEKFGEKLPGDQLLKAYFLKNGFSQNAVNRLIDSLKQTYKFIEDVDFKEIKEGDTEFETFSEIKSEDYEMNQGIATSPNTNLTTSPSLGERALFSYNFEPSGTLRLLISKEVSTEEALEILGDLVELKKKELEKKKKLAEQEDE